MCLSKHKLKHRPGNKKFSQQWTESDRITHRFEALRHIFKTFHEAFKFVFELTAYGKPYWKCLVKIQHILWLISSFKQRDVQERFWSVFKVGEQVSIIFSIHRFFTKFQIFFRDCHMKNTMPAITIDSFFQNEQFVY